MKKIEEAIGTLDSIILIYAGGNNRQLVHDARAELAQLKENLRGIEFVYDEDGDQFCPACGRYKECRRYKDNPSNQEIHTPDCWLKRMIDNA